MWSVAFSPDDTKLATASSDGMLKLWDLNTNMELGTLSGHTGFVSCITFAPKTKDRLMVSGGYDNTVRVWDVNSYEKSYMQRALFTDHRGPITAIAFSSDGRVLASASTDRSVILRRAATPNETDQDLSTAAYFHREALECKKRGDCDEAISYLERALVIYHNSHDVGDVLVAQTMLDLASLLSTSVDRKSLEEAQSLLYGAMDTLASIPKEMQKRRQIARKTLRYLVCANLLSSSEKSTALERLVTVEDANDLNIYSRGAVRLPGRDIEIYDHALLRAKAAVRIDPKNQEYLTTLGIAHFRVGQYQEAIKVLHNATELSTTGMNVAYLFLAMSYWSEGKTEEALDYYNRASRRQETTDSDATELRGFHFEACELLGNSARQTKAMLPYPFDGSRSINPTANAKLRWIPARDTSEQHVYFGSDPENLSLQTTLKQDNSLKLSELEPAHEYFWRVDVTLSNESLSKGDVWSFSTGDLLGWWKFDETEGETAKDSSGCGNHAKLINGPKWVPGRMGGALSFDGKDDYVDTRLAPKALGFNGNHPRTVTLWAFVRSFRDGGLFEMGRYETGRDFALKTLKLDNLYRIQCYGSGFDHDVVADSKGKWVHLALVHDGGETSLYLNGEPVAAVPEILSTGEDRFLSIGRWWI